MFCAAVVTAVELIFPMLVRMITSQGLSGNSNTVSYDIIWQAGLAILILRAIDVFANYYIAYRGHVMGAKIETDMRRDLFAHLQRLSFSFYDNAKIGQIMSRITNDLFEITEFSHHCPEEFFIAGVKIIGSFIILCTVNVPLTLIIFAILPFMFAYALHYNRKMRRAFKKQREQIGEINAKVEDCLSGIRVVKSFANEKMEEEKFAKENTLFLNIKKRSYKYMGMMSSGVRFFDAVMYLAAVVVGSLFITKGYINAADLVAYLLYISTLLTSVRRIVDFMEQFQRGMTGFDRFTELMDNPVDIADKPNAEVLKDVKGEVMFDDVSFKYSDNTKDVLSKINLTVNKGENVAIVGPSGSGKTTLCSLIPRFYEVSEGCIRIDGSDIRDVTLHSLRENIGVVQQDVYLFSGTIKENIKYGLQNATDEQIIEASKKAGAHEFISELKDGYDTYVGERGIKLSGGQKQRISIARVFLKNPPILIFDEATSSLDNESEKIVQQSLELLAKDRTTFIIAHRLSTIRNAGLILVLTENGIEESGTHDDLIKNKGVYAHLYELYSGSTLYDNIL
ncbi:MAG: thiamine ABC transporter permease [Clostridiales bacterium]|nr:MAG: thiamine ABC transporter permease [Clostridiales bacterium]